MEGSREVTIGIQNTSGEEQNTDQVLRTDEMKLHLYEDPKISQVIKLFQKGERPSRTDTWRMGPGLVNFWSQYDMLTGSFIESSRREMVKYVQKLVSEVLDIIT